MKRQYDKDSVHRSSQPGDKVLLFMPLRRFPLKAKYQGPFQVFSKESDVNYVISTPGRRKGKRLVHINLLKEYYPRNDVNLVYVKQDVNNAEEWKDQDACENFMSGKEVKLKNSDILNEPCIKTHHLLQEQRTEVHELLEEFREFCRCA